MPSAFGHSACLLAVNLLLYLGRVQGQTGCAANCVQNGGKCVQSYDSTSYVCDCTGSGGTGPDCSAGRRATSPTSSTTISARPPTSSGTYTCSVLCVNGQCLQQTDSTTYYCKCNTGYAGPSCNTSTSPPPSSSSTTASGTFVCPVPCNNGRCLQETDSTGYYCSCNNGFTGPSCSNQTGKPSAAPPTRGSSPPAGTYTCPVACAHGQCVESYGNYACQCFAGYSGNDCSKGSSSNSSAPTPSSASCSWCKHGTCRLLANSRSEYYCDCAQGYSNWDCSVSTSNSSSATASTQSSQDNEHGGRTLKGWKIFVIVLACMVGVILAGSVAYIVWRRRRSPKTFVKFQDNESGNPQEPQQIEIRRS